MSRCWWRSSRQRLLDALVAAAEDAGFWKLQGRLFTTNEASRALARRCGFREVGVYECHGRLDGEWKDLLLVERLLGEAVQPSQAASSSSASGST